MDNISVNLLLGCIGIISSLPPAGCYWKFSHGLLQGFRCEGKMVAGELTNLTMVL